MISADVGLGLADFRAGRADVPAADAGRRPRRPRRAARRSHHPVAAAAPLRITLACTQNYRDFYDTEIEFRRAMRYPPQVAMVNIVVRGQTFDEAMDAARDLADAARGAKGFAILGPAPAPLTKLRGEHRAQFFLKGTAARRCARRCSSRCRASPRSRSGSRSTSIRCRCSKGVDDRMFSAPLDGRLAPA